jgi:glucan phosphoethanolaminetransferase (alkaline phosphatase superfamily)
MIFLFFLITGIYSYYTEFYLDKYLGFIKIHRIIQLGILFFLSTQLTKKIRIRVPIKFWKSKWKGLFQITPLILFLLLLFTLSITFDEIKKSHFENYSKEINGEMIDYKYYIFYINGKSHHGKISGKSKTLKNDGRKKGDLIKILVSTKNPIINKPLNL